MTSRRGPPSSSSVSCPVCPSIPAWRASTAPHLVGSIPKQHVSRPRDTPRHHFPPPPTPPAAIPTRPTPTRLHPPTSGTAPPPPGRKTPPPPKSQPTLTLARCE